MFSYPSVEITEKFSTNLAEINLSNLKNEEVMGFYLIGLISYHEMIALLSLTAEEGRNLIDELGDCFNRNLLMIDNSLEVDVWKK